MPAQSCIERHAATRVTEGRSPPHPRPAQPPRRECCRRSRARMLPLSTSSYRTASIHTATRVTEAETAEPKTCTTPRGLVAGAVMHGTQTISTIASSINSHVHTATRVSEGRSPPNPRHGQRPKEGRLPARLCTEHRGNCYEGRGSHSPTQGQVNAQTRVSCRRS